MKETSLHRLDTMPFFSKASLQTLGNVSDNALSQNLKRWVKNGLLIRLKNGLFVTKTYRDRTLSSQGYVELVAGALLAPSYVSLEYVLQKHGLLTEATYTITSVITKSGRRFHNPIGTFVYHTVSKDLYFGFEKKIFGKNTYYEARPAKALFDFLYLRLGSLQPADSSSIDELRINWGSLSREAFDELGEIIRKSGIKKMAAIYAVISREFYGHSR